MAVVQLQLLFGEVQLLELVAVQVLPLLHRRLVLSELDLGKWQQEAALGLELWGNEFVGRVVYTTRFSTIHTEEKTKHTIYIYHIYKTKTNTTKYTHWKKLTWKRNFDFWHVFCLNFTLIKIFTKKYKLFALVNVGVLQKDQFFFEKV